MSDEHPYGHMVHEHFVAAERRAAARRAEARARVRTRADLMRLRAAVRRRIRACFGRFPRRTALNARLTGVVRRRAYTIEKVIYESRPQLPVTANLYLPAGGAGPRPAVLGTCGHAQPGKAHDLYQAFAAHLARMGYVVLIYDPLGQGERLQYPAAHRGLRPVGCCREHNMMGNQMALVGQFFGAWRAWDGIRGLDYLLTRPEVDPARVGVTGNSGGGTMTTFLTALDDRFTMAAPGCFVTQYLYNLEAEMPQDAEQCPPGFLAAGLGMADFFVASIPRPTLLLGQADDYFDLRGLRAVHDELKRLYAIVGAADDVELFIGPREHGYYVENRQAMYRFFNKHAGVRASAREPKGRRPETEQTLQATPRGQVHRMRGARRVFDFTRAAADELARRRKRLAPADLPARIARRLQLPRRAGTPHYRAVYLHWPQAKRLRVHTGFAVETDPGVRALVHVCRPEKILFHVPAWKAATVYVPHLSAEDDFRARLAPPGEPLLAVEVRGLGQLTATTGAGRDFFAPYGSDFMYAQHASMLGASYPGRRVHDLLCVLDLLAGTGCRRVHLVGRGLGGIWATFAACLHPLVKRVTLANALRSYHELTQAPVFRWPRSALVDGVLADFDLPDCHRLLRARKRLRLTDPWDGMMRPAKRT